MKLLEVGLEDVGDHVDLVARVQTSDSLDPVRLYFRFPHRFAPLVHVAADAFVPLLIVPCMVSGESLEIVPPVSGRQVDTLPGIQALLKSWYPDLAVVKVVAASRKDSPGDRGAGVGAFFSGGVDSFFTLLRNVKSPPPGAPAITHLVFLNGYENPLGREKADPATHRMVEMVAATFGKEAICGEANFRSHLHAPWGTHYHGAGLAAAAIALSRGLGHMYFPHGTYFPPDPKMLPLVAYGSYPTLDPLWSTGRIQISCDGEDVTRLDKIRTWIADDPVALRHLRVCYGGRGRLANDGTCRKCIRTMIPLSLIGKLPEATSFPSDFPPGFERKIVRRILRESSEAVAMEVRFARQNLELARTVRNPDPRVVRYLKTLIRKGERRMAREAWKERARGWVKRLRHPLLPPRSHGG